MSSTPVSDSPNARPIAMQAVARIRPKTNPDDRGASLRDALKAHGLWQSNQTATRRWAIGCVSLEVTQRCNLDCTLCYLSEHSEAVQDLPLEELFRRIDMIAEWYGDNTDVQVSGGDPTLRKREDLIAIVAYIRKRGMRASLFTNGILATRDLLKDLAQAGLTDVAFHVDMTQERRGYEDETALNAIRLEYIERARGLGLSVIFNTSVFTGNVRDVPMLAAFFAQHSDVVRFASFQMQAATGRGVLRERVAELTQDNVIQLIESGVRTKLNFDALYGGNPKCNRYATAITFGRGALVKAHDLLHDGEFIARVMRETAHVKIERSNHFRAAFSVVRAILARPTLALAGVWALSRLLWRAKHDLPRAVNGVNKISFFIHNFMDASALEQERLDTCVFMAATQHGPMPMCEYNAVRDQIMLQPIAMKNGEQWHPLRSQSSAALATTTSDPQSVARVYPIKFLKGRARRIADESRKRVRDEAIS
jgi:7,8-dihydro-6-hydroxymethylpterin dimethyltransferase